MATANKSEIVPLPEFFDRYIHEVREQDLLKSLDSSLEQWMNLDWKLLTQIGDKAYAPGKWTVKEVLQHINDNERIQSYRALRFARNDRTVLPGYDEDLFVLNSNAGLRKVEDLKEEFYFLRKAAINMFAGLEKSCLQKSGQCFDKNITVLALGFVLAGHQLHHQEVLKERYYGLANQ